MHSYITADSRIGAYSVISVVAIVCAWSMDWLASSLEWPRWLVGVPSFAAFFGMIYGLFDRCLWNARISRLMRLSVIPDVSGTFRGELVSTFEADERKQNVRKIVVRIRQSWTRIEVILSVDHPTSNSISVMAKLRGDSTNANLTYHFRNQIQPGLADKDMYDHEGVAELNISPHGVSGRYFNSRGNSGSLMLDRID